MPDRQRPMGQLAQPFPSLPPQPDWMSDEQYQKLQEARLECLDAEQAATDAQNAFRVLQGAAFRARAHWEHLLEEANGQLTFGDPDD